MSARFDAILFDAGGIFVVPDPGTLGAAVAQLGGGREPERMVRAPVRIVPAGTVGS